MQRSKGQQFKAPFFGMTSMDQGSPTSNDLLCFNCEHIFASKSFLEEHCCPAATHICSCGTEFPLFSDMVAHSKTHQPGHSVLDHQVIRRQRAFREQKETLRLSRQQGPSSLLGVVATPASSLEVVSKYQFPLQSSPNSVKLSKLLHGSAAPTVDLWTIYQPVVVLIKRHMFKNKGTYSCGKCLLRFSTKSNLVLHYNTHARDKVFGCLGCGMLLSSSKSVPQYHQCNSPTRSVPPGVITTRLIVKPNLAPGAQTIMPSSKSKPLNAMAPKIVRLNPFTRPHSNLLMKPSQAALAAFPCGVCRVAFESVKLLQRHKCVEAQRIVLDKSVPRPQSSTARRNITTLKSPYPGPQAARSKILSVAPLGVANTFQRSAVGLSNGTGSLPVCEKIDLDSDDDCYIIESSTIKPNTLSSSLCLEEMSL